MLPVPRNPSRRSGKLASGTVALLSASLILGGCATTHSASRQPFAPDSGMPHYAKGAGSGPASAAPGAPPKVALTRGLLYRLIFAEIAAQRGEPEAAFAAMMKSARDTRDPRLARRATEIAIDARDAGRALQGAALWHTLAPADLGARQAYVSLLLANGRFRTVRPSLEHDLAQTPDPVAFLDQLQTVLAHAPNRKRGFALLDGLAQPYYHDPIRGFPTEVIAARAARAAGDHAATQEHAQAALALRPDSALATILVAQIWLNGGGASPDGNSQPEGADDGRSQAIATLSGFLVKHPESARVREAYARLLLGEGRLEEARAQFQELARMDPQNPEPLFALGALALEAERYGAAREYFHQYLAATGPTGPGRNKDLLYTDMSQVAEGEGRYGEALSWLHKVQGAKQRAVAAVSEALVLGRMGRIAEATRKLDAIPAATPADQVQHLLARAELLRDAHHDQEAYRLLRHGLKQYPGDPDLLYGAAMAAEQINRVDVMEKLLRRLMVLHPDYAHAYNALGYTFADRNIRLHEAARLIDRALALAPDDGFIVDSKGWLQYRQGDLQAARTTLLRAYRLKKDPDVAAHLGEVLWTLGDHQAARALLLQAQRRNTESDSDTLQETLRRLHIKP